MAILVTGASGFVGQAFTEKLLGQGDKVYALSRHPPVGSGNLIPVIGDITQDNLGLDLVPSGITALHHIAGLHSLGEDKDGSIWRTNVDGTKNVIDFCLEHKIPHLYFTSTAYTIDDGRNPYEKSKILGELMLSECDIPIVTVFKPSVIMGTEQHPYPGHFSQFASLVIRVHKRAELVRRKIEGTMRLPVIEPVLNVRGDPEATLNLVPIDAVVDAMVRINRRGVYYLTNPDPPTLGQLIQWIGEFAMVNVRMLPTAFKPTPIEARFQKMAAAFGPYLWGDSFKSVLKEVPPMSREFIHDSIRRSL